MRALFGLQQHNVWTGRATRSTVRRANTCRWSSQFTTKSGRKSDPTTYSATSYHTMLSTTRGWRRGPQNGHRRTRPTIWDLPIRLRHAHSSRPDHREVRRQCFIRHRMCRYQWKPIVDLFRHLDASRSPSHSRMRWRSLYRVVLDRPLSPIKETRHG